MHSISFDKMGFSDLVKIVGERNDCSYYRESLGEGLFLDGTLYKNLYIRCKNNEYCDKWFQKRRLKSSDDFSPILEKDQTDVFGSFPILNSSGVYEYYQTRVTLRIKIYFKSNHVAALSPDYAYIISEIEHKYLGNQLTEILALNVFGKLSDSDFWNPEYFGSYSDKIRCMFK